MPFPERLAHWYKRAADNRCQAVLYSEEYGFKRCKNPAEQVHHIEPESWVLEGNEEFNNPNKSHALALCKDHHSGDEGILFEGGSFHPDMGQALKDYRNGDKESFKKAAHNHHEMSKEGVVFWNNESDEYYKYQTEIIQQRYMADHPEDPKPEITDHKDQKPKKHWYDHFFNGEDE